MRRFATVSDGNGTVARVALQTITPEVALTYLAKNTRNRRISMTDVITLAETIRRGEWLFNGESIVFDSDGALADGQHRLQAVVVAETPITSLVVEGVQPRKAQMTMGQCRKRTLGSQLDLAGEKYCTALASAINVAHRLLLNDGDWSHLRSGRQWVPSVPEGMAFLDAHPELRESVRVGDRARKALIRFPIGLAAGTHYAMSTVNKDDADMFWSLLGGDGHLDPGNPIELARRLFIRDAQKTKNQPRLLARVRCAYAVLAWNYWRAGESRTVLKWVAGGANAYPFPRYNQPLP